MTSHMDFSTGDAPLPDIVILTHKLVRDYQLGTETVKALHGVDIQIQRNEFVLRLHVVFTFIGGPFPGAPQREVL